MNARRWLFALLALCPLTARAAGDPPPHPCMDDVKKFCPDVKPGEGRIRDCLKAHASDLSPDCKDAHARMKH